MFKTMKCLCIFYLLKFDKTWMHDRISYEGRIEDKYFFTERLRVGAAR